MNPLNAPFTSAPIVGSFGIPDNTPISKGPTPPAAPVAAPTNLTQTLAERGNRYGTFAGNAQVAQDLKMLIAEHLATREKILPADQQEALDMICSKISRIVNGDHNYDDSWVDIAGFAKLVSDRLQGTTR